MNIKPVKPINVRAGEWQQWCAKKTGQGGVSFRLWRNPFSPEQVKEAVQP